MSNTYTALYHLKHAGRLYGPGEAVEVQDQHLAEFERLAAMGCVQGVAEAPMTADQIADELEARKAAILAVMAEATEAVMTGDGKPRTDWLEHRLGFDVSAAERDALWAEAGK